MGLARDNFGKTLCLNATNTGALVALGLLSYLEGDNEQAIEFYHQGLSIEPGNTVTLDLLDKALGQLVNLNPIETILRGIPEPLISKTHPLEKYFSDDVMPGMTVSLVKSTAHLKGPPKWATPHETPGTASHSRRASGVLTRSQAKNLPSDPFTDSVPAPDKKSNMIDFFDGAAKSRLFTSSTMMQNDPVQTPPWNPRNETQAPTRSFLKVGSAVSTASSFSFTPMGNGGTSSGSLFFGSLSRAAEPPLGASESDAIEANATFEAHADTTFEDEDVDMELDDL